MDKKIGLATETLQIVYKEKGAIDMVKKAGADCADFYTGCYSIADPKSVYAGSDDDIVEFFSDLKQYANDRGVSFYQTHGRRRIYLGETKSDKICLENARRDLLAAKTLGAKVCVMHGVTISTMGADTNPEVMHSLNRDSFLQILKWAKEYDIILASETFGFCSALNTPELFAFFDEFKSAYERIAEIDGNDKYFKVCIDTGHVNSVSKFEKHSAGDFIREFGKNVVCLHLHDNDGFCDQHLPLYSGTVDWNDVFDALDSVGFDGVYNLEIDLNRYGKGFEPDAAEFVVKLLRFALNKRYSRTNG